VGCYEKSRYGDSYGSGNDYQAIRFKDAVQTNASVERDLTELPFVNADGKQVKLQDFLGEKHVIVVITRGYAGSICPYCSTQTSRLISNYAKFADENAEVVVIYPVETPDDTGRLDEFLKSTRRRLSDSEMDVPFPILLDVGLKAVDQLGIRKSLSKPATYILDKKGRIRFAYVGGTLADRPSIKAMLDQLETLNEGQS
jgi:peroxiredoxin